MSELAGIAEAMLSAAERRLEVVSENIANTTTSGYRAALSFEGYISLARNSGASDRHPDITRNFSLGASNYTGSALDLALSNDGYFAIQGGDDTYYTRAGQFQIDTDGQVVNGTGMALLTTSGAPLILRSAEAEILEDGTVLEGGFPVARIGVFAPEDLAEFESVGGTLFRADDAVMVPVQDALVRQGMLESANVDMAGEMLSMMSALRQAEMGARIVQVYDTLMGQALNTFGGAR